jgi:hypothetical protein
MGYYYIPEVSAIFFNKLFAKLRPRSRTRFTKSCAMIEKNSSMFALSCLSSSLALFRSYCVPLNR